jgi:putative chitinase
MNRNFIKEYQQEVGLTPDGVIGKLTAQSLIHFLNIKNVSNLAAFFGQLKIESANFTTFRENLYYSRVDTLVKTFPKYFPTRNPSEYIKNPMKLGNYIYANRNGNGDEQSGDGYNYRGFGGIQLTGRANILGYLKYINLPANTDLSKLETAFHFFKTAQYFFGVNGLWQYCELCSDINILKLSRAINLGNPNTTKIPLHFLDRKEAILNYLEQFHA